MTSDSVYAKSQAEEEAVAAEDAAENEQLRRNKMCKDPTARTDFLPDKEREAEEEAVRAQLRKEYELRQKVCLLSRRHLHAHEATDLIVTHSQHIIMSALLACILTPSKQPSWSW